MASVSSQTLRENDELVADLARYAESILTESQVRRKYKFDEQVWEQIGTDDLMCEMIEAERVRRIRNGAAKREKAQLHVVAAPDVLSEILKDPKANARHRIDSAKALDDLAGFAPQRPAAETDRVIIHIDMGADLRAKGLESSPADVLHVEAEVRPVDAEGRFVDAAPQERVPMIAASEQIDQEVIPQKRGRGRPRGSKNRPKVVEQESRPRGVPGFVID
jgi:hypothetical protein